MIRHEAKQILKLFEGWRAEPYRDSLGNWTIGWGFTRTINGNYLTAVDQDTPKITKTASEWNLDALFGIAERDAQKVMGTYWHNITPNRQYILSMMCYQLGIGGLMGFKRMIEAIKHNKNAQAGKEMLNSLWYSQTPHRVEKMALMYQTNSLRL